VVVISCLDIRIGWFITPIEYEAVAMLHAMAFEGIVGFFVGCVMTIWRRGNVIHHMNKALQGQ